MKKLLDHSNISFCFLFLLCSIYTTLGAAFPLNSINSNYEIGTEEVEIKTILINEISDSENRRINGATEWNPAHYPIQLTSNKTKPGTANGKVGLSVIDCPEDIVLTVDSSSCTASGELPLPTNIESLCGGNEFNAETFTGGILTVMGSLENGDLSVFAQNLTPGIHHIQYMVNDSCSNVFACDFEVMVPSVSTSISIKQNFVVELTPSSTNGDSIITIVVEDIDNGTNNPCIPIRLEIRKDMDLCGISGNATYNADGHTNDGDPDPNSADYDPDGGQSIRFCCEDLTSELYDIDGDGNNDIGYMKVWMRVWDDSDMNDSLGTSGDTYHDVWTYVKVEDKSTPTIICPSDVTITCDIDYSDLGMTGSASAYGLCGEVGVEYTDIINNLNTCNEGFKRRRFNVVGRNDIFCDQTITMIGIDTPVDVSFSQVADFTTASCPDMIAIGEPTWEAGPCDVIDYTLDTDTFRFIDNACLKLVNHWTVTNWCDYKPNDPTWDGEGLWEHTQEIKVIDETQPVLDDCEDKIFAINDDSDSDQDGEVCEAMITLTKVATHPSSEHCPTGWLKWQVFVDLLGDGTNDLEYSSFLPALDNEFNDTNGNGIPDIYLSPTNSGDEVNIQLPDLIGALSHHKVSWKVTDGCNNVTSCTSEFLITDQTSPTAACQDTITVGISQIGSSKLWAKNYISGAIDNCSSTEDLRYTFSATPPEDDPSYDPDLLSSSHVMTLQNNSFQLPIYIWDERGNFSTCETVFLIDPNLILSTEDTEEVHSNLLHQNQPNPFRSNTSISFDLHQDTPVKLTIISAASAEILEIEIAGKQGLNTYVLDRDLLSCGGLYYYTMTTHNHNETKKMILTD